MMKGDQPLENLPQNFRDEQKELLKAGIKSWFELKSLSEKKLSRLVINGRSTERNLKRLKGIAVLVCELGLTPDVAALLMHSGIATISALADSTPHEVIQRTGRLERQLQSNRHPVIDLPMACQCINKAKRARQLQN